MMYGSMTTAGNSKLSVVQEKGQVTIPSEIREKLGLKKGDFVAFVETEQGVLLTPREVVATETMAKIGVLLKEQGITLEELTASGRNLRGEIIEEDYGLKPDA
jgi:AbrB family looped-hinge helix DNA binding protein